MVYPDCRACLYFLYCVLQAHGYSEMSRHGGGADGLGPGVNTRPDANTEEDPRFLISEDIEMIGGAAGEAGFSNSYAEHTRPGEHGGHLRQQGF